jgi:flagellin-like protein
MLLMDQQGRAVAPVISTILMVAIVVVLAATVSVFFFDITEDFDENFNQPAPNIADTTGEFVAGSSADQQIVSITHKGGDNVAVEQLEIIVRASGPGGDLPTEARLVEFPSDGFFTRSVDETNVQGNEDLIAEQFKTARIIVVEDANVWSAGMTIEFRIGVGGADFRNSPSDSDKKADELEVVIVHTPSNTIVSEHIFSV